MPPITVSRLWALPLSFLKINCKMLSFGGATLAMATQANVSGAAAAAGGASFESLPSHITTTQFLTEAAAIEHAKTLKFFPSGTCVAIRKRCRDDDGGWSSRGRLRCAVPRRAAPLRPESS